MSQNQTLPIKDAIRHTVEQHTLSNEHIEELLSLQKHFLDTTPKPSSSIEIKEKLVTKLSKYWMEKLAGVAAVSVFVVILTVWVTGPLNYNQGYSEQIAAEVVKNHLQLKPLDIHTKSIDGIRRYFKLLDFSPIDSSTLALALPLQDINLLGGRYCSIKGVTAAQLRYSNLVDAESNHRLSTLYQVPYDPEQHGLIPDISDKQAPKVLLVKGLKVSLWVEKGLLMALVSEAQP